MKKNYFVLISFLLFASKSFSQQDPYLDSLYKVSSALVGKYDYKNALENSVFLLEEAKKRNNLEFRYHAHNILGGTYGDLADTLRSKKHYESALLLAQEIKNDTLLLWAYNNLGNIFSEDKKTTEKGIYYYDKVIKLADKLNIPREKFPPTVNIAWTYLDNNEYHKAYPYLASAWQLFKDRKDTYIESQLNYLSGRYYLGIGDLDHSKIHFEKGIALVEEDSLILEASEMYKKYAELLFQREEYKAAYLALNKFEDYNSQIFETQKLKEIEAANAKFDVSEYQKNLEIARKEQIFKDEIIERSRETVMIMIISSIVLVIILLALFNISLSRRKLISELSCKNEQLQNAKEEAERLSSLKTKFFSTISHELRTPLYGVIGLTSILLEDKTLEKHEKDLKSLKFSADYLMALINDVLQMNKMESNLVKLEELPLHLKDLIKNIIKSFQFTRLQNNNEIHLDIDPRIPYYLKGDPVRLSQVLMNLVGNAMKFTERGNIWITARLVNLDSESARIFIEVKDNGSGIPKAKQEIIFEEFSQLKSANYNYQGTGLGLPIVKKLLLLFNSHIQLESEEGVGSSFYFEIDFKLGEAPLLQEEDLPFGNENFPVFAANKKILIVDDNRINQVVTSRILEKSGFKTEVCDNGMDAVEKVRSTYFDLVLMDVNMPGISGLEASRLIRDFNVFVPIIALTAVEIEEIREDIFKSGMNDIIVKPYDTSVFYQVIYKNLPAETAPA